MNGLQVGAETGLGKRINMVMQTVFFKLSNVMPIDEAIAYLIKGVEKMYGKKGEKIVKMNVEAINKSLKHLVEIPIPAHWGKINPSVLKAPATPAKQASASGARAYSTRSSPLARAPGGARYMSVSASRPGDVSTPRAASGSSAPQHVAPTVAPSVDQFVADIADVVNRFEGNDLPVSVFPAGGRVPTGSSSSEKRGIALKVPRVNMDKCTQCNYCSLICPHASIRPFLFTDAELNSAPANFRENSKKAIGGGSLDKYNFRVQVCNPDALNLSPSTKTHLTCRLLSDFFH